ncbi:phosphotransferase family protein [Congregibacter litoralis]|uniref:Putative aminoglycoside phosphotransferase n=1 Tax=Congregibacter litoralis KT71 TaxID=314285 RepID=A4A4Y5_9GAMM|nr:phosphotransferase family protein [Congregibacter litoralis]EAQ98856.1 putative aminoglycoside phosphotransferase [Congregibacter litoralis KT71]
MAQEFETALESVLKRQLPGCRALLAWEQLTAGASQETYRLEIEEASGTRRYALRRSPAQLDPQSAVGTISLETEAQLLQLAGAAGIPGPTVHYVLREDDGLGSGFVMDWLNGETLGQRIVRSEALADARAKLARECGQILGRIHSLDWASSPLAEALPRISPEHLVRDTWATYRDLQVPVPMIDYCYRWLLDNAPGTWRTTLVHGDFRNGNLMVTPEGINGVLDWELAHIGDPLRDLGWLCVNSWRFGNDALAVGGFGTIDELREGYRETSGIEVSRDEIKYWQVFGSFWWAMATLQMADAWRRGETPSLERPVIGRRSSEAQMDCVNLLIPGEFDLPDEGAVIADGTQLPMPGELLSGVAAFLKDELASELQGRQAFLAKVAANSLGIAQREFQFGGDLAKKEQERLEQLLGQRGSLEVLRWELVHRLRTDMALDTPGLAGHLRQTVAGQLAIDQPRYPALH